MANFFEDKLNLVITCASGVEKVTKKELERLGYQNLPAVNGQIEFTGTAEDVVKCNLNLRTADRVYVKLGDFLVSSFDELFDGVYQIDWKSILPKNSRIIVDGKCVKSKIFAISSCQSIVKKAIVDNAGIDVARLVAVLGRSRRTVERAIARLRQQGVIEYRGSKKTGGYYAKG